MRALTIVYILLACTVAGYTQTTATYDNVRARQQLTLNGHTLTSVLQTIDSLSTHAQGVTAKAVYDYIATKYSTVSAGTGIDVVKAGSNYTISLDTLKRLHFRTDSTYSGGVGTMRWNLTDGTLDLGLLGGNVTLQLGQESVQRVKHADNSGLVQGKVVYLVGSDGTNPTVRYARANTDLTSANTFGVMTEDASGGSKAFCTTFGLVRNINTNNLTEGGLVWLSKDTAGALTAVRPTAPNHGVEIGFCIRKHATQGVVFVTVQNGYELNELHDVYAPSPSNNQGLLWKSANSRWEAVEVDTSLNNEGRLIGFKPSNNSYYNIGSSTNGSLPIILYRGSGIGFSGTSGSPEGGDLTISNTGDLDSGNEGILGVDAGAANTSVITSNTASATGVTVSGGTGIAVTETTSTNGGTITVTNSAPDQTVSLTNGGGIGVTGTYPSFTLTATDQSASNEGSLGVGAGTSTSSVITSNTSGASGVTLNAGGGISISETTSSNGGSITLSATDQSITNEGILGVAINPGADAWLRSNTSTANDIGLVGTNNTTINATASSNGGQIVIDSKAKIDTFSLSGQTLRASLLNDGVAASSVTLPIVDVVAGTNVTVSKSNGVATVSATGGGGGGTPAGSNTQIQYNNSGSFGASSKLTWDNTNNNLAINGRIIMLDPSGNQGTSINGIAGSTGIAIGQANGQQNSTASGGNSVAIGFSTIANAQNSISIGPSHNNTGSYATVIGSNITNSGANSLILSAQTSLSNSAVGAKIFGGGSSTLANSFVSATVENVFFGSGENRYSGTPTSYTIYGSSCCTGTNTDTDGGNISLAAGRGMGAGSPGYINFSIAKTANTGIFQTLRNSMRIFGNTGNVLIQDGGSFLDNGYKLRVNATSSTQGTFLSGVGTGSTTYSLICTNSGATTATAALAVRDDSRVGIRTNSIDTGAALEVDGTTGGILFPRLTTTERDALTPTNGLVIYNSTTDKLQVYAGGAWVDLH